MRDTINFERALTEITVIVPRFSKGAKRKGQTAKVCILSWAKKPLTTVWLALDKFVFHSCVLDPETDLVDPYSFNLWTGFQITEQTARDWKARNGLSDAEILGMVRHYIRHYMLVIGNFITIFVKWLFF